MRSDRTEKRVFDVFDDMVTRYCATKSQREAFDLATQEFEQRAGCVPFNSLESYKNARSRHRRKRRGG